MTMLRKILLLIFLLFLSNKLPYSFAQTTDCQDISDLGQKIICLGNKLNELQGQRKTLSSQIAVMDNQISLTQARIDSTKQQISALTLDIDTANKKITNLQNSLDDLVKVLLNRVVITYEVGQIQPFQILLTSNNANNFFSRLNYLKIAQAHDKQLIYLTQQAKNDYQNQKNIYEDKKKKIEALKIQLESYTNQLEVSRKEKQVLLATTQNDENIYQQKLQAALAEQNAIQQIGIGGGNAVFVGKVNEGSIVGHIIDGPSACSSGRHLHFEVHKDSNTQDPSQYLSNKGVTFDNSPDGSFSFGGSWNWPINDPIYIEQGYGMTYWARLGWYRGGPHTGIDIDSKSSTDVRAVKGGDLYRGGISCGGGTLLFGRVDQTDGIQTFYLHTYP